MSNHRCIFTMRRRLSTKTLASVRCGQGDQLTFTVQFLIVYRYSLVNQTLRFLSALHPINPVYRLPKPLACHLIPNRWSAEIHPVHFRFDVTFNLSAWFGRFRAGQSSRDGWPIKLPNMPFKTRIQQNSVIHYKPSYHTKEGKASYLLLALNLCL